MGVGVGLGVGLGVGVGVGDGLGVIEGFGVGVVGLGDGTGEASTGGGDGLGVDVACVVEAEGDGLGLAFGFADRFGVTVDSRLGDAAVVCSTAIGLGGAGIGSDRMPASSISTARNRADVPPTFNQPRSRESPTDTASSPASPSTITMAVAIPMLMSSNHTVSRPPTTGFGVRLGPGSRFHERPPEGGLYACNP